MKFSHLLFLIIPLHCFSQKDISNIEFKYQAKFLIDTADISTGKEEIVSLLVGDKSSVFRSDMKAISDSLSLKAAEYSINNPINGKVVLDFSHIPMPVFEPEVYKKDNKLWVYSNVFDTSFEFEVAPIIWKITNEIEIINKYKCKKATGKYRNRTITAWFTEEIPIPEGPYTFKGLPGLVIEAYDSHDYFHFILMGIRKVKKNIEPIPFAISTDYEKFSKKRNDFKKDPIGAYYIATGRTTPKEQQERIIKMHRRKNNYLD